MIPQTSSITPEEMVAGCRNLVSLPESCMKIRTVLEDPEHSREDLAELIQFDPSLSARVLRIVNSAYYGLPNRISQISSALGIIGEHDLNNLILVTSITQTMEKVSVPELNLQKFWAHSLMNGVLSRQIAQCCLPRQKEQLFVAGLLLDVGQLVMYRNAPGFREEVVTRACQRVEPEFVIEQALIGFDHGEVGGVLASLWHFPEMLIDTVKNHHQVERSNGYELECKIVNQADCINSQLESEVEIEDLQDLPMLLEKGDTQEIVQESQQQFQEVYEAFFGHH
jgi:HD-like signal output (HDOD) protein